jgi:hypothetical protein
MNKYFSFSNFYIASFFLFLFLPNLLQSKESSFSYGDYFYEQLEKHTNNQDDIDFLFSEYCFINFYVDPICKDDEEELTKNSDIDKDEIIISSSNKGEIFYTTANVNLRKKPTINSEVLKLILKDESIKIFEVVENDDNWFLAEYENLKGYVHSKYISKEKVIGSTKGKIPQQKNKSSSNVKNNDDELKKCLDLYSGIDSHNTREIHNQFCTCSVDDIQTNTTLEDKEYYEEFGEESEEYLKKIDEIIVDCAINNDFIFEANDENKKFIDEQTLICKNEYDDEGSLNKNDFNYWCECYHNKLLFIITDEDFEFFEKNDEWSDIFYKKEDSLSKACFSELR